MTEASGSLTSHYIISAIQQAGHLACGSDVNDFNAASQTCDDFIIIPYSDDPQLWDKTYSLLEKHKISIVLPTFDETLYEWSLRKEELQKEGLPCSSLLQKRFKPLSTSGKPINFSHPLASPRPKLRFIVIMES